MSPSDLLARTRASPFKPFRLILIDGQTYDIQRPDMLLVGHRSAMVGGDGKNPIFYPITQQVALRHICRVELLEEPPTLPSGTSA
jgi:hypothetical protein